MLAALALALAAYYYFTGEAHALPWLLVPHLQPVPLVLDSVAVGPAHLPLPANGYLVSLTHDVAGPFVQPGAAALWLGCLALALAGWLAVVSALPRPAFLAGTIPVVLLLHSLNLDALGVFDSDKQYFLGLALGTLGAAALYFQLFGERAPLWGRVAVFGAVVAGLAALLAWKTPLPAAEATLQTAAYALPAGLAVAALVLLWVGIENIRALVWFNTQAERPEGRFGLLPLLLASALYLGALGLYYWNDGDVPLLGGLHLDPLVLVLPAVVAGGLGLRLRAPSFGAWVPLAAARPLYWLLVLAAAGVLAYALATANAPLLDAARDFSVLALGLLGAVFLLYVLVNFGTLLQQRLRVYRVLFEPRRLPLYAVYVLGLGILVAIETRQGWPVLDQVKAGQYNQLGDLTRQQSEGSPDALYLATLAERYYAESGDVLDRFNRPAQLGRAALYRQREQYQNERNMLRRALLRQPDAKISAYLAAQLTAPADFLDALEVLRQGRRAAPRSFPLTSDEAQLFTRSALTDSVAHYLDRAEQLAPNSYVGATNQLGFLLTQKLYPAAAKLTGPAPAGPGQPALQANQNLLRLLTATRPPAPAQVPHEDLDAASFAQVNQVVLLTLRAGAVADQQRLLVPLAQLIARPANATYYEQLLLLEALLLHGSGQEVAARQTLAPLAVGTGPVAAYSQYVLGLWQLQQQQYATATRQLTLAAAHGSPEARLARAWALAYGGQPDSARTATQRLLAGADAYGQRQLGQLQQVLATGAAAPPAAAALVGAGTLARAQAAAAARQPQATRLFQQVVAEAPFNEAAVLAAARYYTSQQDAGAAYEALRLGLLENPDSPALLQAYALTAADAGLADLGQTALDQLRPRLSPAAYANLLAQFAARRATHAAAMAAFAN